MSDTPTPKTPEQKEAFSAVVEAIGDALYLLLADSTFTEEETESFSADVSEVAFLALDMFNPQVTETETGPKGEKKFTFEMTVPTGDMFEILKNHYQEVVGDYHEEDEDDEE